MAPKKSLRALACQTRRFELRVRMSSVKRGRKPQVQKQRGCHLSRFKRKERGGKKKSIHTGFLCSGHLLLWSGKKTATNKIALNVSCSRGNGAGGAAKLLGQP